MMSIETIAQFHEHKEVQLLTNSFHGFEYAGKEKAVRKA